MFSGLGVDRRVFDNIDFSDMNVEFIDWIEPIKNEPLKNYAKRISLNFKDENPIIIGLSFGGILAVEISKIVNVKKLILIASAKTKYELPFIYRLAGKLKFNKIIPSFLLKSQNVITNWLFGIQNKSDAILLKRILKDTDPKFIHWAINEIVNWNNIQTPKNHIHIHGSNDIIIPVKNLNADYIIKNAGHFMTVNRSNEIEKILRLVCK